MNLERAVIEINGGCNYTCQMCPQTTTDGKHGARGKNWLKKMPIDLFEEAVAQSTAAGATVINLEGSGEPTLNRNLPEYIDIVRKYGAKSFIFSNGFNMRGDFMKDCVDAGLDFFRFSIIGYNEETYRKWMNSHFFNLVIKNMNEMHDHVKENDKNCVVATYHLILDDTQTEFEKEQYLKIIAGRDIKTEIWKMHNWSGVYETEYERKGKRKTCGRPFSPDVVIRAGGKEGETGAVHPCCQVLGNDDAAVLGHLSKNTIKEIWYGNEYEKLRDQHRTGDYPDFCKGCDFLIDDPEVLVYSNYDRDIHQMNGVEFSLNDYR